MHTSKMIPDASSWIIKFPKVPFAHRILRAATASLMNHSGSARIYGKRAAGTEKRENGPCVLLDCPDENHIRCEQSESVAGCCGAPSTGDEGGPMNRLWGFAWLTRRLSGSRKPLSVWGVVISSFDFMLAFKVELLSQAMRAKNGPGAVYCFRQVSDRTACCSLIIPIS